MSARDHAEESSCFVELSMRFETPQILKCRPFHAVGQKGRSAYFHCFEQLFLASTAFLSAKDVANSRRKERITAASGTPTTRANT